MFAQHWSPHHPDGEGRQSSAPLFKFLLNPPASSLCYRLQVYHILGSILWKLIQDSSLNMGRTGKGFYSDVFHWCIEMHNKVNTLVPPSFFGFSLLGIHFLDGFGTVHKHHRRAERPRACVQQLAQWLIPWHGLLTVMTTKVAAQRQLWTWLPVLAWGQKR